jgi:phenylpropionate dioxygenase-like ring-hydroxylating dioxygenase large terminal subunit
MALSLGRVTDDHLECPYHGWRYNQSGICALVPSLGELAKLPKIRVRSFPVIEQDGYIWIFPGEPSLPGGPFHFPCFGEKDWTSFKMKTRFAASVEACLENFLDCPHTVFVHKGYC